jgi:hypothetical protein
VRSAAKEAMCVCVADEILWLVRALGTFYVAISISLSGIGGKTISGRVVETFVKKV